ncbi:MAG: hypothetical protein ACE5GJ_07460 [Gemmatimonadota bacterium]
MSNTNAQGSDYADAVRGVLERAAEVEQAQGQVVDARESWLTRPPVVGGHHTRLFGRGRL